MRATVLPPTTADEMYRVVLGPYPTREEAETIGRKLGMPYWIFQRDTTTAP
jgi:cell division protein FtsN